MIRRARCPIWALAGMAVFQFLQLGCAHTKQVILKGNAEPGSSRICVFKKQKTVGAAASVDVFDGKVMVGTLKPKGYLDWFRPAGHVDLFAGYEAMGCQVASASFEAQPDSTYYFSYTHLYGEGGLVRESEGEARARLDGLPQAEVLAAAPSYSKANADTTRTSWPGPISAEARWAEAWPRVRTGMTESQLNANGIYIEDVFLSGIYPRTDDSIACLPCAEVIPIGFGSDFEVYVLKGRSPAESRWITMRNGILAKYGTGEFEILNKYVPE
jgi:hypothetical protein